MRIADPPPIEELRVRTFDTFQRIDPRVKTARPEASCSSTGDVQLRSREHACVFCRSPYRKKFAEKLEQAGFGRRAIDAAAFGRALPSLTTIERLIKAAEKRLADCLKKLDLAYSARDREDPRSQAALRADDLQEKKTEELRKARNYDQRKATGGRTDVTLRRAQDHELNKAKRVRE